jgi:biopolymer transport protein ExbB
MGLQFFRTRRLGKLFLAAMAGSMTMFVAAAYAQAPAAGDPAAAAQGSIILETVISGFLADFGPSDSGAFVFQWVIVLAASCGVGIAMERFYTISLKSKVNTSRFTDQLVKFIESKDYDKALALCNASPGGLLPQFAKAGLDAAKRNVGARAVQDALDEKYLSLMPNVTKRLTWVSALANVATLLGLMGTIFGLMYTFAAVALIQNPKEKTNKLSQGIAVAMNTTLLGLICAVPLNLMFQWLNQASRSLVDDVDECSVRIINALTHGGG